MNSGLVVVIHRARVCRQALPLRGGGPFVAWVPSRCMESRRESWPAAMLTQLCPSRRKQCVQVALSCNIVNTCGERAECMYVAEELRFRCKCRPVSATAAPSDLNSSVLHSNDRFAYELISQSLNYYTSSSLKVEDFANWHHICETVTTPVTLANGMNGMCSLCESCVLHACILLVIFVHIFSFIFESAHINMPLSCFPPAIQIT